MRTAVFATKHKLCIVKLLLKTEKSYENMDKKTKKVLAKSHKTFHSAKPSRKCG